MSDDNQNEETIDQVGDLIDTYTALDATPITREMVESNIDLKQSLTSFVNHYLERVRGHKDIEDILKEALIERLPSAEFEQIMQLLNTVMRNSNNAIDKIMAPFTPKPGKDGGGETVNNFLFNQNQGIPIEEKILKDEQMTPEMIKGLYDLAQMMNVINLQTPSKK